MPRPASVVPGKATLAAVVIVYSLGLIQPAELEIAAFAVAPGCPDAAVLGRLAEATSSQVRARGARKRRVPLIEDLGSGALLDNRAEATLWTASVLLTPGRHTLAAEGEKRITLALVGCATLFYIAGTPYVVSEVTRVDGNRVVVRQVAHINKEE